MIKWKVLLTVGLTLTGTLSSAQTAAESTVDFIYEEQVTWTHQSQKVTVTWYTSSVDECDDTPFITADGTRTRRGIVAVSRDLQEQFAFGDSLFIDGMGWYEVHDVMNERWTDRVDIWCESKQEARNNGVQYHDIFWQFRRKSKMVKISLDN